jgi:16S rRNA processing protein RimM
MWVRVARIGKPFGVKGLVTVQVFTDAPEQRLVPGASLARADDGSRPVTITTLQRMGSRWVIGLDGVSDRTAVEQLRDEELFARATDVAAGDDEWFDWQLIGLTARDPMGYLLGEIVAVEHPPAHDLLVVRTADGRSVRVPFVTAIVPSVTPEGVVVQAPGGLFDHDGQAP